MKPITPKQLKLIHTLLSQQGLMELKPGLCLSFSDNRTFSSKELTSDEASAFITYLKDNDERKTYIKRIWHLAYKSGIIYGDTEDDKHINAAMLDVFCKSRGTVKKAINSQSLTELKRTVKQFESIAEKAFEKQAVNEFIAMLEYANEGFVQKEEYESAAHNQKLIERAKKDTSAVIQYFKQNPDMIDEAKEAYSIINSRNNPKVNHYTKI